MSIIDKMADPFQTKQVYGIESTDSELVTILGQALMDLARANPENCTSRVTQALAIFHMWEASRR